jgi:predicted phosphate transport protein (TIGR00153 family)
MPVAEKLFQSSSPFQGLQKHMQNVRACIDCLQPLFKAFAAGDRSGLKRYSHELRRLQIRASDTGAEFRSQLPSLLRSIGRQDLLETMQLQGCLADRARDTAVTLCLRPLRLPPGLQALFDNLLDRAIRSCLAVAALVDSVDQRSALGKVDELEKMVRETEAASLAITKELGSRNGAVHIVDRMLWLRIVRDVGELAETAGRLGAHVRLMVAR